jgi:hypothetical protein
MPTHAETPTRKPGHQSARESDCDSDRQRDPGTDEDPDYETKAEPTQQRAQDADGSVVAQNGYRAGRADLIRRCGEPDQPTVMLPIMFRWVTLC